MKIIDVSHHNGRIKWLTVSKNVDQAFIKATEGSTYADPMFIKNAIAAHTAGIKIGYYHFATLNTHDVINDAKREANWFLYNISLAPINNLPLVLDIETNKIGASKKEVLTFIHHFILRLINADYIDFMIYSYTSFLNDNLPKDHDLGKYKLWLADYNEPHFVPVGWDRITLLQYTDKGKVNGITGNVDLNRYL